MKALRILGCTLTIALYGSWASAEEKADELLGEWYTEDNESKVVVEKKNGKYSGKIVWLSEPAYEPGDKEAGVLKHDRNNRKKSLRDRPIIGITMLSGFTYDAKKDVWSGGKIYDPENGKEYKCVVRVSSRASDGSAQSLDLRGFIGISLLGRTTVWNRVLEDENKVSPKPQAERTDFPAKSEGVVSLKITSPDGTLLHASVMEAEDPVAGLLLVHGMQSHSQWFEVSGTLAALSDAGISCLAYDRRGSGRSGGKKGHAKSAEQMLEDFETALKALREILAQSGNPDVPLHVLANCFGTRITLPYLTREPDAFQSAILTAPATRMTRKADYGKRQRARILLAPPSRYFKTPLEDSYFISSGPALEWIENDELSLRRVTAGFLRSAQKLTKEMRRAALTLTIPFLVVLGTHDEMVKNDAIRAEFVHNYKGPIRVVEYDAEHYIDFTSFQPELADEIVLWITQRSSREAV